MAKLKGSPPRFCLGLFAAAEVLGFRFVHGVQPHLYIEQIDRKALRELGFVAGTRRPRSGCVRQSSKIPRGSVPSGSGARWSADVRYSASMARRLESSGTRQRSSRPPPNTGVFSHPRNHTRREPNPEFASFASLIESLMPWPNRAAVVGAPPLVGGPWPFRSWKFESALKTRRPESRVAATISKKKD